MVTLRDTSFTPSGGRLSIYIELFECVTVWAFRLSAHNCCTVQWSRMTWTGVFIYTSKRTNEWHLTRLWFWINDIHIGWCVINFWLRNRRNTGEHYTWWRHQMETLSALLALCAGNSPVPVNSPHKGQWRGALMFSLICARINVWVNNGEAGDLRRNRAHNDVTVMISVSQRWCWGLVAVGAVFH